MKTTKLERAVATLGQWLHEMSGMRDKHIYPHDADGAAPEHQHLRTVLAALTAQTPSAVQRAERAVVRAAMVGRVCGGVREGPCDCEARLAAACDRLERERAKAKKVRRP